MSHTHSSLIMYSVPYFIICHIYSLITHNDIQLYFPKCTKYTEANMSRLRVWNSDYITTHIILNKYMYLYKSHMGHILQLCNQTLINLATKSSQVSQSNWHKFHFQMYQNVSRTKFQVSKIELSQSSCLNQLRYI